MVHSSASASRPAGSFTTVRSWFVPVAASNDGGVLEVAHLEVGRERADHDRPAGTDGPGHAGQHAGIAAPHVAGDGGGAALEPERALAERDGDVEAAVVAEPAGVAPLERHQVGDPRLLRGPVGHFDERGADVDAGDPDAQAGERDGVPAGPATDVEHLVAGAQPEVPDEEGDLLVGALREAVAEIGAAEVRRHPLEPVRLPGAGAGAEGSPGSAQLFAEAHESPNATLTSSGTRARRRCAWWRR